MVRLQKEIRYAKITMQNDYLLHTQVKAESDDGLELLDTATWRALGGHDNAPDGYSALQKHLGIHEEAAEEFLFTLLGVLESKGLINPENYTQLSHDETEEISWGRLIKNLEILERKAALEQKTKYQKLVKAIPEELKNLKCRFELVLGESIR